MSDLATLEKSILEQIAGAPDEAALEAVRIASLGKKGSISALLATLGKMSPDERKTQGAAINLAKDKVTEALATRRDLLKSAALDARLASETIDVTLPLRDAPADVGAGATGRRFAEPDSGALTWPVPPLSGTPQPRRRAPLCSCRARFAATMINRYVLDSGSSGIAKLALRGINCVNPR